MWELSRRKHNNCYGRHFFVCALWLMYDIYIRAWLHHASENNENNSILSDENWEMEADRFGKVLSGEWQVGYSTRQIDGFEQSLLSWWGSVIFNLVELFFFGRWVNFVMASLQQEMLLIFYWISVWVWKLDKTSTHSLSECNKKDLENAYPFLKLKFWKFFKLSG